MQPPIRLSLIIPCYNEAPTLEACVELCLGLQGAKLGAGPNMRLELELVIVDDCSTDSSFAIAQDLAAKHTAVRVLRHEKNLGKGAALRTGFTHATGEYIGVQDADAEYNPQDYLLLLAPMLEGKADVVYGSRYLKQDSRRVLSFWHTWMNRTLTFASNMFTNLDISDMETCYKLFRREIIQEIAPKLQENRFGFEPEVTAHVARMTCRVYECAIHYNPRTQQEGKKIGWRDGVRALYCILHYSAHTAPLPMQILLYFFIGGASAVVNLGVFALCLGLDLGLGASVGLAFGLAALVNYLLCMAILFRHKARWSSAGEIMAYVLVVALMLGVDYAATYGLMSLSLSPMWSKAWATLLGFVGNFLLRKYYVF